MILSLHLFFNVIFKTLQNPRSLIGLIKAQVIRKKKFKFFINTYSIVSTEDQREKMPIECVDFMIFL